MHLELFHITIGQDPASGEYLGAVYSTVSDQSAGVRDKNLYNVLRKLSARIKEKEKERLRFPLPSDPPNPLIVLPNGKDNGEIAL